ncbi:MAG: transporter related [Paenibacillaceae bacterium]|jgi:ATP-binding cassette subfamily B protein|nr:transporter related [Paenibacillaceae bacterium]
MILQSLRDTSVVLKMAYRLDKHALWSTALAALTGAAVPFIPVLISAYTLDALTNGQGFSRILTLVLASLAALFVLRLLESLSVKIRDVHVEVCTRKFNMELSRKNLLMDYELLESPRVTALKNRIRNDDNWGAGFYSVFWSLSNVLNCLFRLAAAFALFAPLLSAGTLLTRWTGPVLLTAILAASLLAAVAKTAWTDRKLYGIMQESAAKKTYFGYFVNGDRTNTGGKDVRIYGGASLIWSYVLTDQGWSEGWKKRFARTSGMGGLMLGFASGAAEGLAYVLVVLQAAAGAFGIGAVLKYAAAIYQFSNGLSSLVDAWGQLSIAALRQKHKLEYLDVPDVLVKGTLPVEKRNDNEYEIGFRNVSFRYPGSEDYALRNITLTLNIGTRMAVVGLNGSGKTTFIKLLCRLYDPTDGEITLNGIDIRKYDYAEYMSLLSVVFQDFRLFSFSLGQNVAAGVEYDSSKVESCVAEVGLWERYTAMEKGAESILYKDFDDSGIEISGGEAQKIALARALYKDAPFIILDEPTAALDPIAEYEIYSQFNTIVGDKTTIYISHRLSSCRFCDLILVFHKGQIVQQGCHDVLLRDGEGQYAGLWNVQAQYYVEEPVAG